MNFPEKIEKALLDLRLARSTVTTSDLEGHKKELDKIILVMEKALKEYWEGYYG